MQNNHERKLAKLRRNSTTYTKSWIYTNEEKHNALNITTQRCKVKMQDTENSTPITKSLPSYPPPHHTTPSHFHSPHYNIHNINILLHHHTYILIILSISSYSITYTTIHIHTPIHPIHSILSIQLHSFSRYFFAVYCDHFNLGDHTTRFESNFFNPNNSISLSCMHSEVIRINGNNGRGFQRVLAWMGDSK